MITLEPGAKAPLYEQLYGALAAEIRAGALKPGSALPGRRAPALGGRGSSSETTTRTPEMPRRLSSLRITRASGHMRVS